MVEDLRFSKRVKKKVDYSGQEIGDVLGFLTYFEGEVNFMDSKFSGRVDFHLSEFYKSAIFSGESAFLTVVSFTGAKFHDIVDFDERKFSHNAFFENAFFYKEASFLKVKFIEQLSLNNSRFYKFLDFDGVLINRISTGDQYPMVVKTLNLGSGVRIKNFRGNSLIIVRDVLAENTLWPIDKKTYYLHDFLRANVKASLEFFREWKHSEKFPSELKTSDKKLERYCNYWNRIQNWCFNEDNHEIVKDVLGIDFDTGQWLDGES